jgi:hypothetical protein
MHAVGARPWARGWKNGPPQAKNYIHPALNFAGFGRGEPKRVGMLKQLYVPKTDEHEVKFKNNLLSWCFASCSC